jgi:hypothetical protein
MKRFLKTLLVFFKLKKEELPPIFKNVGTTFGVFFLFVFVVCAPMLLICFIAGIVHTLIYPYFLFGMDGIDYYSDVLSIGVIDITAILILSVIGILLYRFFSWIRDNWREAKTIVGNK